MKVHIYKNCYIHDECISDNMRGVHLRTADILPRKALKKTCQICNESLVNVPEGKLPKEIGNEISPGQVKIKIPKKKKTAAAKKKKSSKKKKLTTTEIHFNEQKRLEKEKDEEMAEIKKRLENEVETQKVEDILDNINNQIEG